MFTGTSHLLSLTATALMFLTPGKLSKNFLYNLIVSSALRVSSKLVDYKTQSLKHSFYLADEFRRSDHKVVAHGKNFSYGTSYIIHKAITVL
jgi:hypothetical protein